MPKRNDFDLLLEKCAVDHFCDVILLNIEEIKPYIIGCKTADIVNLIEAEAKSFKSRYGSK